MKALSNLAQSVRASTTLAIDTQFNKMRSEGIDVIGFSVGQPDFPTPEHIKQAGLRAIQENLTKYTPTPGTPAVRKAVADRLDADWGLDYTPEEIVVSGGGKPILYVALKTLIDPGDEVILPAPYWVSYYELIKMVGGVPVVVTTTEENGFNLTPEQLQAAITPKTKALMLNSPSNPTGMIYSREHLEDIAKVCLDNDLYVIADEMYSKLVFDNKEFVSFPTLSKEIKARTILVGGASKTYAMTGWRLGYACGPAPIIRIMTKIHQSAIMSAPTTSQYAAITALKECDGEIDRMRDEYNMRRRLVVKAFNDMGLTCFEPRGAFYAFPCIKSTGMSSQDFCTKLLEQKHVAIIPGDAFGASGEGYARISYAYSVEHLKEALRRIREFLQENGIYHGI